MSSNSSSLSLTSSERARVRAQLVDITLENAHKLSPLFSLCCDQNVFFSFREKRIIHMITRTRTHVLKGKEIQQM